MTPGVDGAPTSPAPLTLTLLVVLVGSSVSERVDPSTTSDPCSIAPEVADPSTLTSLSPAGSSDYLFRDLPTENLTQGLHERFSASQM
jgi:hypothetical protein